MTKIILSILSVIKVLAIITGCSDEGNIKGIWMAHQITQNADIENNTLITKYNYWDVKQEKIELKYSTSQIQAGKETKVFDEKVETVNYEWIDKDKVVIDNTSYNIEIKRGALKVWNENIEILFEKME